MATELRVGQFWPEIMLVISNDQTHAVFKDESYAGLSAFPMIKHLHTLSCEVKLAKIS